MKGFVMKFARLFSAASLLQVVTATPLAFGAPETANLQSKFGESACLKRLYSADHLERNPKQFLTEIYFQVKTFAPAGRVRADAVTEARIIGKHGNRLWGNGSTCDFRSDGSLFCFVECDGGSFSVTPRKASALLQVTPGYYYPLFHHVPKDEAEYPEVLSLDGNDRANSTYLLVPTEEKECAEAIERFEAQPISDTEC